jgi:hypothetical protein
MNAGRPFVVLEDGPACAQHRYNPDGTREDNGPIPDEAVMLVHETFARREAPIQGAADQGHWNVGVVANNDPVHSAVQRANK